jgi:hypothetical protein
MEDYSALVVIAREQLIAEGHPMTVPADKEEEGKALLCRRAAWLVWNVDHNVGLFKKTSGNNVQGLSVDILVDKRDGSFADCASSRNNGDGTVDIIKVWVSNPPDQNTSDTSRWVQPTAALAGVGEPVPVEPPVVPVPVPNPPSGGNPGFPELPVFPDYAQRFDRLEQQIASLIRQVDELSQKPAPNYKSSRLAMLGSFTLYPEK